MAAKKTPKGKRVTRDPAFYIREVKKKKNKPRFEVVNDRNKVVGTYAWYVEAREMAIEKARFNLRLPRDHIERCDILAKQNFELQSELISGKIWKEDE